MNKNKLVEILKNYVPYELASDLINEFLILRQDVATNTFCRSAPGKFVESLVQILQFLDSGVFDTSPNVDAYLRSLDSRNSSLDDGLRLCAARIGRAMYTLRNKRNIAHKGQIDPNKYDMKLLYSGAQWILSELIRSANGESMEETGKLIEQINTPIGSLVEDFEGHRLVLGDLSTREEIMVLLHSYYPEVVSIAWIISSLNRRSEGTVRNVLRTLRAGKLIEKIDRSRYRLTQRGFHETINVVKCHTADSVGA